MTIATEAPPATTVPGSPSSGLSPTDKMRETIEEQNKSLVSEIVDMSKDKIPVGEFGETPEERVLNLSPEAERFAQQKEKIRDQVEEKYDQSARQTLMQKQGDEVARAVEESGERQSEISDSYYQQKAAHERAYDVKNLEDEAQHSRARAMVSAAKEYKKEGIKDRRELLGLREDILDKNRLTEENLEILNDPELTETLLGSISTLEQAEVKLASEIKEKEGRLRKIGVQKTLVKSYGKILSALQGIRVFGIDKAARRTAMQINLPGEKNDGSEYWAKQEIKGRETEVEKNLLQAKDSVEEAIVRNEDAIEEARGVIKEHKGKASIVDLITSRAGNFKKYFEDIRKARKSFKEDSALESSTLDENIYEISRKDMSDYTGIDYDKFLQATKDSVVATQSQDSIAHRQAILQSNEANKEFVEKSLADRYKEEGLTEEIQTEVNNFLDRTDRERAKRQLAPMTEEERNSQIARLLGTENIQ
jgi:hypothetical protein